MPFRRVVSARETHRERGGGFALEREIGQHFHHQRLRREGSAERDPVACVMKRSRECGAHQARRRQHAIETRVLDHLENRRYAAPGFANRPRIGTVELDFRRCIRPVAELVFEAVDPDGVARSIGKHPRQQEA